MFNKTYITLKLVHVTGAVSGTSRKRQAPPEDSRKAGPPAKLQRSLASTSRTPDHHRKDRYSGEDRSCHSDRASGSWYQPTGTGYHHDSRPFQPSRDRYHWVAPSLSTSSLHHTSAERFLFTEARSLSQQHRQQHSCSSTSQQYPSRVYVNRDFVAFN